ncbi:hypothetical protein [Umezawaea sp. Da 62-37]|uniref:hypothetical protein n=1 Tax=Umezawaea sp. Da 62-37 TaxID=3075927 RepID=UPI0028F6FC19|nr:hypothetical protein [Umezawaea sp. Da 62-37]WNV90853.1 hypothetical protein RM788_22010 [Umezawaea sp. Da 62-37]
MTSEAFARFRADLSAAVTRGRRAAAAAGARNAEARDRSRDLAEGLKATRSASGRDTTSPDLRKAANGFREERGLPVERLPEPAPPAGPAETEMPIDAKANAETRTTPGSRPVAGPRGQLPRAGDDDEDFSQGQILY